MVGWIVGWLDCWLVGWMVCWMAIICSAISLVRLRLPLNAHHTLYPRLPTNRPGQAIIKARDALLKLWSIPPGNPVVFSASNLQLTQFPIARTRVGREQRYCRSSYVILKLEILPVDGGSCWPQQGNSKLFTVAVLLSSCSMTANKRTSIATDC